MQHQIHRLSYYKTINHDFFEYLSTNYSYNKLSVNAIIILIFQHIGKDKNYIIETMGFSDQAYQSQVKDRESKKNKYIHIYNNLKNPRQQS